MSTLTELAEALPREPQWDNSDVREFGMWLVANEARINAYSAELHAVGAGPAGPFWEWMVSLHETQLFRCQQAAFNDAPQSLSHAHPLHAI